MPSSVGNNPPNVVNPNQTSGDHMSNTIPANSISLAGAQQVVAAAIAASEAAGLAMCIAVVDCGGEPVLTARMDGAARLSAGIALNKAFTVTGFYGMPTSAWWDVIKDEPALVHGLTHTPRLTIFGGGVALVVNGQIVGAIGVSGGSADQDADVATAGAAALS
jgi:glc operon protein GlcG